MKNLLKNKIIFTLILYFTLDSLALSGFAFSFDSASESQKHCLSPALHINHAQLRPAFFQKEIKPIVTAQDLADPQIPRLIVIDNSSVMFNNRKISLYELTRSLKVLLRDERFINFARKEKDTVKYASLSSVEKLLFSLKQNELAQYREQIELIVEILHLEPETAAIIFNGLDPMQQKAITNLTDKAWTNRFRMKRFNLAMGKDQEVYNAWYDKAMQTTGQEKSWWYSLCRLAMPLNRFNDLKAALLEKNQLLIAMSI
jgi:hypothetical protein